MQFSCNYVETLGKTAEQDGRSPNRDLETGRPEEGSGVLTS